MLLSKRRRYAQIKSEDTGDGMPPLASLDAEPITARREHLRHRSRAGGGDRGARQRRRPDQMDAGVAEATEVGDQSAAGAGIWWHQCSQSSGKPWRRSTTRTTREPCLATWRTRRLVCVPERSTSSDSCMLAAPPPALFSYQSR